MDPPVDLVVVGFGKAGKTLAATLGRQGRRVALGLVRASGGPRWAALIAESAHR